MYVNVRRERMSVRAQTDPKADALPLHSPLIGEY